MTEGIWEWNHPRKGRCKHHVLGEGHTHHRGDLGMPRSLGH